MPTYRASQPSERLELVPAGDYEVEVIDALETVSKSGHEMIELKLRTSPGSLVYDFLVFTPSAFWKIDAFRIATGETLVPDEDVNLTGDDLIGRTGRVRLVIEEFNGRKRNKLAAWLPRALPNPQEKGGSHGNPF